MAFVAQCPFCKLKAKAPDRANGAIGHCPKCGNSYTLAPADDVRLPEPEAPVEAAPPAAVQTAHAEASAGGQERELPWGVTGDLEELLADEPGEGLGDPAAIEVVRPEPIQPAAVLGALALLSAGVGLTCGAIGAARRLVTPLAGLGVLLGAAGLVTAALSARRRVVLPAAGLIAPAALLLVALLFPSLLGQAYRQAAPPAEPLPGLQAIPLGGAAALSEVPEWVDARHYALRQGGLRVQVLQAAPLHQQATDDQPAEDFLLVRIRVQSAGKPIERRGEETPILSDEAGKRFAFKKSEVFERGDGKSKSAMFAAPTIEETLAFEVPDKGATDFRIELPAARYGAASVFRFQLHADQGKGKK